MKSLSKLLKESELPNEGIFIQRWLNANKGSPHIHDTLNIGNYSELKDILNDEFKGKFVTNGTGDNLGLIFPDKKDMYEFVQEVVFNEDKYPKAYKVINQVLGFLEKYYSKVTK